MQRRSHRVRGYAATAALMATLSLGLAPAAFADDGPAPPQPSAIERLTRQEDARKAELARYDATAKQSALPTTLDARERALVARPDGAPAMVRDDRLRLDPAIRAAMAARAAAALVAPTATAGDDEFAWGAAALGLGAGVAAMCVLLGCVTLVRDHGRLRSV